MPGLTIHTFQLLKVLQSAYRLPIFSQFWRVPCYFPFEDAMILATGNECVVL